MIEKPRYSGKCEKSLFPRSRIIGINTLEQLQETLVNGAVNSVVTPNHPTVLDPLFLRKLQEFFDPNHRFPAYAFVSDHYSSRRGNRFSAGAFAMAKPLLGVNYIPVPQKNRKDEYTNAAYLGGLRTTVRELDRILGDKPTGNIFILFPEGKGSIRGKMCEFPDGVATLVKKLTPAVMLPIGIVPHREGDFFFPHPFSETEVIIGKPYMFFNRKDPDLNVGTMRDAIENLLPESMSTQN